MTTTMRCAVRGQVRVLYRRCDETEHHLIFATARRAAVDGQDEVIVLIPKRILSREFLEDG